MYDWFKRHLTTNNTNYYAFLQFVLFVATEILPIKTKKRQYSYCRSSNQKTNSYKAYLNTSTVMAA